MSCTSPRLTHLLRRLHRKGDTDKPAGLCLRRKWAWQSNLELTEKNVLDATHTRARETWCATQQAEP